MEVCVRLKPRPTPACAPPKPRNICLAHRMLYTHTNTHNIARSNCTSWQLGPNVQAGGSGNLLWQRARSRRANKQTSNAQTSRRTNKQTSKQRANKQTTTRGSEQPRKRANEQTSKHANEQTSKRANEQPRKRASEQKGPTSKRTNKQTSKRANAQASEPIKVAPPARGTTQTRISENGATAREATGCNRTPQRSNRRQPEAT